MPSLFGQRNYPLKASKKTKGKISWALEKLAENGIATFEQAKVSELPMQNVLRSFQFGGLCYVSEEYFHLIMRLEYIFVKSLTTTKLCVLGKDLIECLINVYMQTIFFANQWYLYWTTGHLIMM